MLSLLHLSDIHFDWRYANGDPYERNADIRNELEEDVRRLVAELGSIDAIIIGGDVAYHGAAEEYARATTWLEGLAEICGCERSSVWTVPGNHDVDRSIVGDSNTLKWYRERLRDCPLEGLDEQLDDILHTDPAGRAMFEPLANYNNFAEAFDCAVSVERPFWTETFDLQNGTKLLIQGVTSVLVSDGTDSDEREAAKLILGEIQALVPRSSGRASLVVCHHPPTWLRDGESAERRFIQRTQIQLYGHVHEHDVHRQGESIAITAGAVHPERGLGLEPRYNLLRLAIEGDGDDAALVVHLYPRVWDASQEVFAPHHSESGDPCHDYRLSLAVPPGELEPAPLEAEAALEPVQVSETADAPRVVSPLRELLYRFAMLPYAKRLAIAESLGLIQESDRSSDQVELHRSIFLRTKERDLFAALWDAVAAERQDHGQNPFRS